MRITFLTVMPSPYVQDLFAALAADARIDLTVWYLEQVAPDTYWGEQTLPEYAQVLPGKWYGVAGARVHWNPGIQQLIKASDADLFVIVGYIGLTNQIAMRTLNRLKRPWCFWGEIPGLNQRSWLFRQIRRILQKPLTQAVGIAAVGSRALAAYHLVIESLCSGRSSDKIFRSIPYHCRLDGFQHFGAERKSSDTVRFLYCGQLIHRKGVDLLCRAFCEVLNQGGNATLTITGEGPLRDKLQQALPERWRDKIQFLGFQPVDTLPQIFGKADIFVLPSRHDGWGVVVNQALAAGMPVIATDAVGAAEDLVRGQGTGWVIAADSEEALLNAFLHAIAERTQVAAKSGSAFAVARNITLDQAVTDWNSFLHDCLSLTENNSGQRLVSSDTEAALR